MTDKTFLVSFAGRESDGCFRPTPATSNYRSAGWNRVEVGEVRVVGWRKVYGWRGRGRTKDRPADDDGEVARGWIGLDWIGARVSAYVSGVTGCHPAHTPRVSPIDDGSGAPQQSRYVLCIWLIAYIQAVQRPKMVGYDFNSMHM